MLDILRAGLKLLQTAPKEDSSEDEAPIADFVPWHRRKLIDAGQ